MKSFSVVGFVYCSFKIIICYYPHQTKQSRTASSFKFFPFITSSLEKVSPPPHRANLGDLFLGRCTTRRADKKILTTALPTPCSDCCSVGLFLLYVSISFSSSCSLANWVNFICPLPCLCVCFFSCLPSVLVAYSCYNKASQTGWYRQQKLIIIILEARNLIQWVDNIGYF